jgi:hypothetical protein
VLKAESALGLMKLTQAWPNTSPLSKRGSRPNPFTQAGLFCPNFSLSSRGTSEERAGERRSLIRTASSPRTLPPSEWKRGRRAWCLAFVFLNPTAVRINLCAACSWNRADVARRNSYGSSCKRIRRYSICPRSPSKPIGPVSGTFKAASRISPLQVQWAAPFRTVTTTSFQSCGLYCLSSL